MICTCRVGSKVYNEEQIIIGYPIDGAIGSSGGGRVQKLSVVCWHNNAFVARGILVTTLHCGTPESGSAPSILLVLLEPHWFINSHTLWRKLVGYFSIMLIDFNKDFKIIITCWPCVGFNCHRPVFVALHFCIPALLIEHHHSTVYHDPYTYSCITHANPKIVWLILINILNSRLSIIIIWEVILTIAHWFWPQAELICNTQL